MRDTDATGALFFSRPLEIGLEAFEAYLDSKKFRWREMVNQQNFFMPIVHVEGDFYAPVTVGDQLDVQWAVTAIHKRSFEHHSHLSLRGKEIGEAVFVHAVTSASSREAVVIPTHLHRWLVEAQGAQMNEEDSH